MVRYLIIALVLLATLLAVPSVADAQCYAEQTTLVPGEFGYGIFSVAMDGNIAVVGTPALANNRGAAWVFRYDGTGWVQEAELVSSDPVPYESEFGWSVAVHGNVVAVGEIFRDNGYTWIFRFDGTGWHEEAELSPPARDLTGNFGLSLALEQDVVAIGAFGGVANQGAAYVYRFDGTTWNEEAELLPWGGHGDANFGWSVAMSGDAIVVGSSYDTDKIGSAYVFRYHSAWLPETRLTPSDSPVNAGFGWSVAVHDDIALIGAIGSTSTKGAAYLYRFDGTAWNEEQKLQPSNGFPGDQYGRSVSVTDQTALVTAYDVPHSFFAWFYSFDGTGWSEHQVISNEFGGEETTLSEDASTALILSTNGVAHVFTNKSPAVSSSYGTGWPGTMGVPVLASDPPVIGSTMIVTADNSLGAETTGVLIAGFSSISRSTAYGGTLLVGPAIVVSVAIPVVGLAVPVTVPADCSLILTSVFVQVLEIDPGATRGVSFTNGLELDFGN